MLTRLLQPVLEKGGTMCMLACVHPGAAYAGETNAVLDYAKTTSSIVRKVPAAGAQEGLVPGRVQCVIGGSEGVCTSEEGRRPRQRQK